MRDRPTLTLPRWLGRLAVVGCLAGAALVTVPLVAPSRAFAASPLLRSANVPNYAGVLETASGSLYVLSTERGAKVHCTAACLSAWHPLLVRSSVHSIAVGSGVKGAVGFVKRSSSEKQVTFNTYPLYTYAPDTSSSPTKGEAVAADGGTWRLVHAVAKTAAATPYLPILNDGSTPSYKGVLQNSASRSLYVLSSEQGGTVHCTGGCLSIWPPLLVTGATTSIAVGAGVTGTIGFVTRGSMKQVTFNSYPVYTYTGDTGPSQCTGEGVVADGGTWTLADAGATGASATPVAVGSGCSASSGWVRHP